MSDDNVVAFEGLTAAERIKSELEISGGYRFAPGITIHAPSKRKAELIAHSIESLDMDNLDPEDLFVLLQAILQEQYEPVMEFLDEYPVEAYPALLADMFENILKLVPKEKSYGDKFVKETEARWKAVRPDLFSDV